MAWIESHQQLLRHPKTARLARLLGVSVPTAIGHLHCFWWWAMDYAPDGDLSHADELDIATAAMWEGDERTFFEALERAGFIDLDPVRIHDWDDYGGKLNRKRAAHAERMKQARAAHDPDRDAHVRSTTTARATHVQRKRTVEREKSREEDVSSGACARAEPASNGASGSRRKTKQTGWDPEWQPSPATLAWAGERGWKGDGFEAEFAKFRDHHGAKGSTFADWNLALKNWLRRAEEYGAAKVVPIRGPANGRPDYDAFTAVLDDIIAGGGT